MMKLPMRPLLIAAALGLTAGGLGGCGFTPLYAAPGVSPKLAAIDVSRPDGRTGFLLGQYLDDDFARDRSQPPEYRLLLKTRETRIPRGIRVNNVASRYEVQLATTYTLVSLKTRLPVTTGLVQVNVTYDSADQPYAGIAAEGEGQKRAAEQAAQRIRLELASYFASPSPAQILLAKAAETAATAAATAAANGGVTAADAGLITYSERLQPATVLSPRERALGQPTPEGGAPDLFGRPLQSTTPQEESPPVAAPEAPLTDPYAAAPDPAAAPGQR
jgi:LPS-assembly lipoprotein